MPAPRKIIQKEVLVNLIENKLTRKQMQEELNLSKNTLSKILKEYNLSTRSKVDENIGKRFGKLVVLERVENTIEGRKVYKCKCDCGNITKIKGKYLYNGDTKSCGCYEKDFRQLQEKNYKEALKKVGEKHGMLTIIDVEMGTNRQAYYMICRCECGSVSRKIYSNIVKGRIVSCGCYASEMRSKQLTEQILNIHKNNRDKNWYFKKDGDIVYCRSGYEVIYANHLMINNIDFEYEPEHFKLLNGKRYTPDFYLVKEDKYIEIKGIPYEVYDKGNQRYSIELFRKTHKLDIIYWNDLYEMCNLPYKCYGNYKVRAKALGVRVEDYLGKLLYLTY
ncbi:MAG: hypothetical protein ACRCXA_01365 [Peptostreptococcaceae bacterium]